MSEARKIELPDGTVVWARVSAFGGPLPGELGPDRPDRPSEVGAREWAGRTAGAAAEKAAESLKGMNETIKGVAASVHAATREITPDEVRVEFGLELSGSPGHLVAMLADGETRMTFKVSLTWRPGAEAAPAPAPEAAPAPAPAAAPHPPGPTSAPDGQAE